MNIYTVRDNLVRKIASKEKYLSEIYEHRERTKGMDEASYAVSELLEINIDELKRILAEVEICCTQATEQSWQLNPERMGQ